MLLSYNEASPVRWAPCTICPWQPAHCPASTMRWRPPIRRFAPSVVPFQPLDRPLLQLLPLAPPHP